MTVVETFDRRQVRITDYAATHEGHAAARGRFPLPADLDPEREVVLAFDRNTHAYLVVGGLELHGRIVNLPVLVRPVHPGGLRAIYFLRLKNLAPATVAAVTELVRRLEGTYTLSCINAILHVFEEAGIRLQGPAGRLPIVPSSLRSIFSRGLADRDGRPVEIEICRTRPIPLARFYRRMLVIETAFLAVSPITLLPGLLAVASGRRRLVVHRRPRREGRRWPAAARGLAEALRVGGYLIYSTVHNAYGSWQVIRNMMVLEHGTLEPDHPWVTGRSPEDGEPIWPRNLVFRSAGGEGLEADREIVCKVGAFMAAMVKKSTGPRVLPHGPKRRMSHAVNTLHGTVHYNGAFFVFNDFGDVVEHMSDPRFAAEIRRFTREERRELTIVCRQKDYDPGEFAYLIGFMRSTFPWYANANGPKKRVLYGVPAPYPVVNLINGTWTGDMKRFRRGHVRVCPPIPAGRWFQDEYRGERRGYRLHEKAIAFYNYQIVKRRGFQGGMVFHLKKRIEPAQHAQYREARRRGERPEVVARVENPWQASPRDPS